MGKQTATDRHKRVQDRRCPIHGMEMGQVGLWRKKRTFVYLVECLRRDCQVQAIQNHIDGPIQLTPKWRHLLAPTVVKHRCAEGRSGQEAQHKPDSP